MTNAYVESMVAGRDGETVMGKYKDGGKENSCGAGYSDYSGRPRRQERTKGRRHIIIFASEEQADGSLLAKVIYVGRDVTPAM